MIPRKWSAVVATRSLDSKVKLKLVSASYDAEYLAYRMKYDSIHGRYDGIL